jgi:hypothetical protein
MVTVAVVVVAADLVMVAVRRICGGGALEMYRCGAGPTVLVTTALREARIDTVVAAKSGGINCLSTVCIKMRQRWT